MESFRVRLNCIDYYQATPSRFDPKILSDVDPSASRKEPKVPVIRVFGATETGQRVCAHVHGAFPYLYIEYDGSLIPDQGINKYIHRLHLNIDNALAISYRRDVNDHNSKYVARITLVKGIPFYGFYIGYRYFLKIYMLDPMVMTRLSDVLRQGAVMNKSFQPYEAHLQYLLQWMTDYNLYGCNYLHCSRVKFRNPVPKYVELEKKSHLWHDLSIPQDWTINDDALKKSSYCSIEVDLCIQDILNRKEIKPRNLHHDFVEHLNPPESTDRLVHSMAELWKDETRRRKSRMSNPDPGSSPFPAEVLISMSADPRYTKAGSWIHEENYKQKLDSLITEEKNKSNGMKVTFGNFLSPMPLESSVKTALEAVEDFFPENLCPLLGLTSVKNRDSAHNTDAEILVGNKNPTLGFFEDSDDQLYSHDSAHRTNKKLEFSPSTKSMELEIKTSSTEVKNLTTKSCLGFQDQILPAPFGEKKSITKSSLELYEVKLKENEMGILNSSDYKIDARLPNEIDGSPTLDGRINEAIKRKRSPSPFNRLCKRRVFLLSHSPTGNDHASIRTSAALTNLKKEVERSTSAIDEHTSNKTHCGGSTASTKVFQSQKITGSKFQDRTLHFPVVKAPRHVGIINGGSNQENIFWSKAPQKEKKKNSLPHSCIPINSGSKSPPKNLSLLMKNISKNFDEYSSQKIIVYYKLPPSTSSVISSMQDFNLAPYLYQDAFYSNVLDVPEHTREWAGREFKLRSSSLIFLHDFNPSGTYNVKSKALGAPTTRLRNEVLHSKWRQSCSLRSWSIAEPPPSQKCVSDWFQKEKLNLPTNKGSLNASTEKVKSSIIKHRLSQIEGPTQKNQYGFKFTQGQRSKINNEALYMSTMSLEIHVNTRKELSPDPEKDEVKCLFWCLRSDLENPEPTITPMNPHLGVVVSSEDKEMAERIRKQFSLEVNVETSELDLMLRLVDIVRNHDPDILTGYEIQNSSWGYLVERARLKYDYDLCEELSRIKPESTSRYNSKNDQWGLRNTSTVRVTGRQIINIWRAMRSELNLLQYTIENIAFHLLHRRIPHFTRTDLTKWFSDGKPRDLAILLNYYISRAQINLEILERNEFVERTCEQARLLGVDFASVISRGSQFKVESLMFRIAKPENLLLISPSRKQIGSQNALECLPLVMEPQSAFYTSPVLVLDFQSLYPSVIIAYNYCYSTFLGRIVDWRGINKMGFTKYERQQRLLELLQGHINISPNGMMFVKPTTRKSLLAKMLGEILETRVMVKSGMKIDRDDKELQKSLNNRQLALKLISNVTYGYTSASFSGRMPCSEIADSIVQTGRETLEKSIALIHSVKRWGAEVVYGDTDSLFVYLKGRTKDQAFDIGAEIAKTITDINPRPIKLKFEKVYLPCVLIAKKRYVGFKYESRDQVEPEFDAKGIETVRRDGTPAEQKIQEKALKILFRTSDLSQVKEYFQSQCEKIMKGSVSIQDFCFSKEVRLGTYSEKGQLPPSAMVSTKRMIEDVRSEPQYGERVPYVVISGAPGARLLDRCVAPEELFKNSCCELDSDYYISKNLIPPLGRIFDLIGVNVRSWYDEMRKFQWVRRVDFSENQARELPIGRTMESYMKLSSCVVCWEKIEIGGSLCPQCSIDLPKSLFMLRQRLNVIENKFINLQKVCQSCSGISPVEEVKCYSKDCPVFYTRKRVQAHHKGEKNLVDPIIKHMARTILSDEKILD
ncbi:DNA polymerase zeta catalytic subunit [Golovinomyces cichoracearum]|uniref:DNA polymerase n=1 Tax=Golovinomyces cichoracearum TaxID=62708 RepID=A0A420ILY6_9PEZI|nr:DNA polymerase zeta catalytic subunit [Golovinomyces cichoracearum]